MDVLDGIEHSARPAFFTPPWQWWSLWVISEVQTIDRSVSEQPSWSVWKSFLGSNLSQGKLRFPSFHPSSWWITYSFLLLFLSHAFIAWITSKKWPKSIKNTWLLTNSGWSSVTCKDLLFNELIQSMISQPLTIRRSELVMVRLPECKSHQSQWYQ